MSENSMNYQCPNCGGPLKWDPQLQKLHCEYCDSSYTAEEVENFYKDKESAATQEPGDYTESNQEWSNEETQHMRVWNCPSCGAQLIAADTTAVTNCPYCGNTNVTPSQFTGAKKPQYVLPFQIDKKEAESRLMQFYKGKPFLPRKFADENHIQEVKGVYVPFWLYDGTVTADMIFRCEKIRQYTRGDEIITETSHFNVVRKGTLSFEKVPADASKKMPDEYMDAIEPFDYSKLTKFNSAYMAGYLADVYDITSTENQARTDERMKKTAIQAVSSTVVGYSSVVPIRTDVYRVKGTAYYSFLPVWLLTTEFAGKHYLFAVNGQTGKVIGNLPADNGKFGKSILIWTIVIFAIIAVILLFTGDVL